MSDVCPRQLPLTDKLGDSVC